MINRRDALKRIGALAGAAAAPKFLSACGSDDDGPVGITHYVYLMLENRSYDNVLGARSMLEGKPGDGITAARTNPDLDGNPISLYEPNSTIPQLCIAADPPHGWDSSRVQFNNGANDGFVRAQQANYPGNTDPMQYFARTQQPVSWALADAYTSCDRWYASIMGPTMPNRFYWHCATSSGYRSNDVIREVTSLSIPSIYHGLRDANVEWRYYYGSLPVVAAFNFQAPYNLPGEYLGSRVKYFGDSYPGEGEGDFFTDAMAGNLPPVTYIDPFFYVNDDHPPSHPLMAQQLIASIYTALARSPLWKNCMFVVTYDEHGGFFDHVPPPTTTDDTLERFGTTEDGEPATGFDQLGFRVPTLVIGPYVKQGYVSSVQYDHTSALKHLGTAFGLPDLSARMAAANDLTDCIDMDRLERGDWAKPIEIPQITINTDARGNRISITSGGVEYPLDDTCDREGEPLRTLDPISEAADLNPELFGGLDARPRHREYIAGIDAFLKKHQTT